MYSSVPARDSGVPLVSVIVRSMARPSLAAALASLARQDHPAIEVLVVAAAGAAHPPVAEHAGAHAVRLVASDAPLSRAAAANAGLAAARGAWITFLDDDDELLPEHVSGLVRAHDEAPQADVVHCHARAVFANGRVERFGQPHATLELYDRNYLHLSTAIVRSSAAKACRFDDTLVVHEDWDFFLQLARDRRFHFVPRETFIWHADAGTSGAAGGVNQDDALFAHYRDQVYAKWTMERDALVDRVTAHLEPAQLKAQRGDYPAAEAHCRMALEVSQNDPWALNLLAMVKRSMGDLAAARAAQELAVAVRPNDAAFAHNLALLAIAQHDLARARECIDSALRIDPTFTPAQRLKSHLDRGGSAQQNAGNAH